MVITSFPVELEISSDVCLSTASFLVHHTYIQFTINDKPAAKNHTLAVLIACTNLLEIATLAPRDDSIWTIPLPRPVPPPVTNATFPSKDFSGSIRVFTGAKYSFPKDEYFLIFTWARHNTNEENKQRFFINIILGDQVLKKVLLRYLPLLIEFHIHKIFRACAILDWTEGKWRLFVEGFSALVLLVCGVGCHLFLNQLHSEPWQF